MSAIYTTSNSPGMNAFCPKEKKKKKTCNFQKFYMSRKHFWVFTYIIETPEIIVPNN